MVPIEFIQTAAAAAAAAAAVEQPEPQVVAQLAEAFPTLLQLVDDVADFVFFKDAEAFKDLVAEVLHSVCNVHIDVLSYTIPDALLDRYHTLLSGFEQAVESLVEVEGTNVKLSLVGRALVKYSKFRPVTDVVQRTVKVYDGDARGQVSSHFCCMSMSLSMCLSQCANCLIFSLLG
jgi:hypothetical protein